eukprot:Hpha_TRINITY_DN256_c0_g1::TRINITY_DN256_c0_g1_i1::g.83656::m.83656
MGRESELESTAPPDARLALQLQISKNELIQLIRDTLPTPAVPGLVAIARGPLLSHSDLQDHAVGRLVRVLIRSKDGSSVGRVCSIVAVEARDDKRYPLVDDIVTQWWLKVEHGGKSTFLKIPLVDSGLFSDAEVAVWAATATAPTAGKCRKLWQNVREQSQTRKDILAGKLPWPNVQMPLSPVLMEEPPDDGVAKMKMDGKWVRIGEMTQPELARLVKRAQALSRQRHTSWRERWDIKCDEKSEGNMRGQRDPARKSQQWLVDMLIEMGDPTLPAPPPDVSGMDYCFCKEWCGPIEGYFYGTDAQGLGYYKDPKGDPKGGSDPSAKRQRLSGDE